MLNNKELKILRVSFTATSEDWVKFRDLSKKFGWNINTVFTKMFYDALKYMETHQPQHEELTIKLEELR